MARAQRVASPHLEGEVKRILVNAYIIGVAAALLIGATWAWAIGEIKRLMAPADLHDWDNDEWWKA